MTSITLDLIKILLHKHQDEKFLIRKLSKVIDHSSRILDIDIAKYKSLQDELELGPVSKVVSEIDDNKRNDLGMMDVVDKISEINEIAKWNQVEISNKSNNDPIKLFTVEVKDLVTTEEVMMLGELSMDD
ncbi:276_t:CDS:2 [Entrophospora sp. SA101]|nr:276_t:CDS:2 [Entrophospora sp. SA101]